MENIFDLVRPIGSVVAMLMIIKGILEYSSSVKEELEYLKEQITELQKREETL